MEGRAAILTLREDTTREREEEEGDERRSVTRDTKAKKDVGQLVAKSCMISERPSSPLRTSPKEADATSLAQRGLSGMLANANAKLPAPM